jgi:hypothetical protein
MEGHFKSFAKTIVPRQDKQVESLTVVTNRLTSDAPEIFFKENHRLGHSSLYRSGLDDYQFHHDLPIHDLCCDLLGMKQKQS